MTIETIARGRLATLAISRDELVTLDMDLEAVPLRFEEIDTEVEASGTTISLKYLRSGLNFPTSERLREALILEYGREDAFCVYVDGAPLSVEDVPGITSAADANLDHAGPSTLTFTIAEGKVPRAPGIVVKVNGKSVGRPQYFGLDDDEEIPAKLLKRVYGEVHVDGAEEHVTADWGALVENSKVAEELREFVSTQVKSGLKSAHASTMNLQKARLQLEINRRLEKLPEHRRDFARRALEQLMLRYYEENVERVEVIVEVALDAMEHDAYWAVIESIKLASDQDMEALASSLNTFGLVELSAISFQASRRSTFLDYLDQLASNPSTLEKQVHTALENNLWVLGRAYSLLASNVTLKTMVEKLSTTPINGTADAERPGLLLTEDYADRHVLIEFKRPSLAINRDHISQAEKYRDVLRPKLPASPRLDVLIIGKGLAPSIDPHSLAPHVTVQSYMGLISSGRGEMSWLMRALAAS